jgi:hypothetical protein
MKDRGKCMHLFTGSTCAQKEFGMPILTVSFFFAISSRRRAHQLMSKKNRAWKTDLRSCSFDFSPKYIQILYFRNQKTYRQVLFTGCKTETPFLDINTINLNKTQCMFLEKVLLQSYSSSRDIPNKEGGGYDTSIILPTPPRKSTLYYYLLPAMNYL